VTVVDEVVAWVGDARYDGRHPWVVVDELERRTDDRRVALRALGRLRLQGDLILARPGKLTTPAFAGPRPRGRTRGLQGDARRVLDVLREDGGSLSGTKLLAQLRRWTRGRLNLALAELDERDLVERAPNRTWRTR